MIFENKNLFPNFRLKRFLNLRLLLMGFFLYPDNFRLRDQNTQII